MRSLTNDDDHGHHKFGTAFDASSFAAGSLVSSGVIRIHDVSYARGGPGSGGGGGGGGGSTTFTSGTPTTSDNNSEYNIQITFKGTWTPEQITTVKAAANLISDWITADIQDVLYKGKIIDDLSLTMEISNIDGINGILGQAGPTAIRSGSSSDPYLPAAGIIQFDLADMGAFADQFGAIVLHEILHTVGFGSVWTYLGLLDGAGTTTPTFIGEQATNAYEALYHDEYLAYSSWGFGVPVENEGGSGTAGSHWDEQVFDNELMTGYIDASNVLSDVTIASLGDLGYVTILGSTYMDPPLA
jgi:hypothetical protein